MRLGPLALACVLVGCGALGLRPEVKSSGADVGPLVERHDQYVRADVDLSVAVRVGMLEESEALLALVGSRESMPREVFRVALVPVVDRYDAYLLREWEWLSPLHRRVFARTSDLARALAELPSTEWPAP